MFNEVISQIGKGHIIKTHTLILIFLLYLFLSDILKCHLLFSKFNIPVRLKMPLMHTIFNEICILETYVELDYRSNVIHYSN